MNCEVTGLWAELLKALRSYRNYFTDTGTASGDVKGKMQSAEFRAVRSCRIVLSILVGQVCWRVNDCSLSV